jgi:general secretion pathway protein K
VLLLAFAAGSFTLTVRSSLQHTGATAASAQAAALAEAAAQLAIFDLVNSRSNAAWQARFPPDGRTRACSIAGSQVLVTIADEGGRVDINTGSESVLRALLIGLGVGAGEAGRLAASVADYRDGDDTRRQGGAERADYREAGREVGPKNAPFDHRLEIAQVLGMDGALAARLQPHVTIHSGLTGVDPAHASPALVDLLSAGASTGAAPTMSGLGGSARLPPDLSAVSPQRTFAVTAQATGDRGATFALEAIVRLTGSRQTPYAVLGWAQVDARTRSEARDNGDC